jgi:uncharacterized protein (TIGR00645 family)
MEKFGEGPGGAPGGGAPIAPKPGPPPSPPPAAPGSPRGERAARAFGALLFGARWLQAPIYLGLVVAQGVYVYRFLVELYHLVTEVAHLNEEQTMLLVLGLVDVAMIANLLVMVIVGGYDTFVSRLYLDDHPDRPDWLSHMDAGTMKVKFALALVGISSVHLLRTFIDADDASPRVVVSQVAIHLTFLVSALAIAYTNRLMQPSHPGQPGQPGMASTPGGPPPG